MYKCKQNPIVFYLKNDLIKNHNLFVYRTKKIINLFTCIWCAAASAVKGILELFFLSFNFSKFGLTNTYLFKHFNFKFPKS